MHRLKRKQRMKRTKRKIRDKLFWDYLVLLFPAFLMGEEIETLFLFLQRRFEKLRSWSPPRTFYGTFFSRASFFHVNFEFLPIFTFFHLFSSVIVACITAVIVCLRQEWEICSTFLEMSSAFLSNQRNFSKSSRSFGNIGDIDIFHHLIVRHCFDMNVELMSRNIEHVVQR